MADEKEVVTTEEPVAEVEAPAAPTAAEEEAAAPAAEEEAAAAPAEEEAAAPAVVEEAAAPAAKEEAAPAVEEAAAAVEEPAAEAAAAPAVVEAPASTGGFTAPTFSEADRAKLDKMSVLADSEMANANPLVKITQFSEDCKSNSQKCSDTCQAKYCASMYTRVKLTDEEEAKIAASPNTVPVSSMALGARACCACSSHGSPKEFLAYNMFDVANMSVAVLIFLLYGVRVMSTYGYDKTPGSWESDLWTRTDAAAAGYSRAYMSGPYGSGEFIITLLIAIAATGIFVAKLIRHVFCPDRMELTRRADYDQLESYRSQGGSASA